MSGADEAGRSGESPGRRTPAAEGKQGRDAAERARAKRRAKVFGDVLPESTSDESGAGWGDRQGSSDEWLRREVPPHHG